MKYCNRILTATFLLFFVQVGHGQSTAQPSPAEMLRTLQNSPEPFALYQQAYPSFVFSSSTQLKPMDPSQGYVINQATTVVEVLEQRYKRIDRKPFAPLTSIEIIENEGIQYLKPHQESTYYQIKNNPQRERLEKTIYTEAFDLLDTASLLTAEPVTEQGRICYSKNQATLCFDRTTALPISGQIRKPYDDQTILTMVFALELGEKNITVQKPTQVHALRKHTTF
jgi:hypothetical protein